MKEVFSKQSEFERFYRACVAFAKSYTYDDATAESIASEAMLVFWEKQKTLEEDVPALPYLLGIARNLILHHLRSEQSRSGRVDELTKHTHRELQYRLDTLQDCDPNALFNKDIRKIIDETLSLMDDNARKSFILSRYYGYSYKEISAMLGISVKTVEYHISRTLAKLRIALKDYLPIIAILFTI